MISTYYFGFRAVQIYENTMRITVSVEMVLKILYATHFLWTPANSS